MEDTETIEERAEDGKRKPPLTDEQRATRNAKIIRMKMRGLPTAYIAEEVNLSERAVRNVWEDGKGAVKSAYEGEDAVQTVRDFLNRYETIAEEFAVAADKATGATKVQALNGQMNVLREISNLCQATGILPEDLHGLRAEVNWRATIKRVMDALDEVGASVELRHALYVAMGGAPIPQIAEGSVDSTAEETAA